MNRQQIIQAFINGKTDGKASSLSIAGDVLYSYQTAIAQRHPNGVSFALNITKYSQTTSVHQGAVMRALKSHSNLPVPWKSVDPARRGVQILVPEWEIA